MTREKITGYFMVAITVLAVISLGYIGYTFGEDLDRQGIDLPLYMVIIYVYAMLFGILMISIILHEGGHLIMGLLTGYKLMYFRVGSTCLVRYYDGYKIRKQYMPGAAGQCVLYPPEKKDGKFPYLLYNLGGLIMNTILALIAVILLLNFENAFVLAIARLLLVINVYILITNGIPMDTNDAGNIVTFSKSKQSRDNFWTMLRIEYLKMNDDPKFENLEIPESIKNDLTSQYYDMVEIQRLINHDKKQEALERIERYLSENAKVPAPYKIEAIANKAYLKTYMNRTDEEMGIFKDKELKNYFKGLRKDLQMIRIRIMYHSLVDKDDKKLQKEIKLFEKEASRYYDKYQIRSERNLVSEFVR
ncbi:MAG: hypothetical protein GXY87_01715 [Tissierellia bacterium]|nr:hypothetical protein [Tissierellia bacterium]